MRTTLFDTFHKYLVGFQEIVQQSKLKKAKDRGSGLESWILTQESGKWSGLRLTLKLIAALVEQFHMERRQVFGREKDSLYSFSKNTAFGVNPISNATGRICLIVHEI